MFQKIIVLLIVLVAVRTVYRRCVSVGAGQKGCCRGGGCTGSGNNTDI
jgi:hypothetical protein